MMFTINAGLVNFKLFIIYKNITYYLIINWGNGAAKAIVVFDVLEQRFPLTRNEKLSYTTKSLPGISKTPFQLCSF